MAQAMTTTVSRMAWLSRLLLMVAMAVALETLVVPEVEAIKARGSINQRLGFQRDLCEVVGGGTLEVRTLSSGTKVTYCNGGTQDGYRCVNKKKDTSCTQTVTPTPPSGGGGIHVGIAAPPQGSGEADPQGGQPQPPLQQ